MFKPGLRNIKTALSVVIVAIIISFFDSLISGYEIEYFYAGITAVFTLQQTTSSTLIKGRDRIMGTFIGMFIAMLFLTIQTKILNGHGEFILLFIAIIVTIQIINIFRLQFAVMIGCIMVIGAFSIHSDDYIIYSFIRALETVLGVVVAIGVNKYIFPYNEKKSRN